ncbi:MAG: helix-turn-helix domain-containing protein [Acetobacteraceae bacterium]|nr:helix-turn-helix domain-containing protein [Acetobacteraceae bacterium]
MRHQNYPITGWFSEENFTSAATTQRLQESAKPRWPALAAIIASAVDLPPAAIWPSRHDADGGPLTWLATAAIQFPVPFGRTISRALRFPMRPHRP